jgi:hypothetical protein
MQASGVFEHGTWIHRLTCWTCRDCQAIVAVRETDILASAETAPPLPSSGSAQR